MTVLEEVAADVGVHERTLRRGLAEGLLRGRRPTVRTAILAPGEARYLRAHWPLLAALRAVLRTERNVRLAVLIGSAARGELTEGSDVDLLVDLENDGWRPRDRLRGRLGAAVDRPVDLLSIEAAEADPLLLRDVLEEGRVLVDRAGHVATLRDREADVRARAATATDELRAEIHSLVARLSDEDA